MVKKIVRAYQRWQYRRSPRPVFIPTVTPIERVWSDTDERLERGLYLANPSAFWLRPDRHQHKVPCWQIEGIWEAPPPNPMQNAMHHLGGLGQLNQLSSYQHSLFLQNQYAAQRMHLHNSFGGLGQGSGKIFG